MSVFFAQGNFKYGLTTGAFLDKNVLSLCGALVHSSRINPGIHFAINCNTGIAYSITSACLAGGGGGGGGGASSGGAAGGCGSAGAGRLKLLLKVSHCFCKKGAAECST